MKGYAAYKEEGESAVNPYPMKPGLVKGWGKVFREAWGRGWEHAKKGLPANPDRNW